MKSNYHIKRFTESVNSKLPKIGEEIIDRKNDSYIVVLVDNHRVILKPKDFPFNDGREFIIFPDDFEGAKIDNLWYYFNWVNISNANSYIQ